MADSKESGAAAEAAGDSQQARGGGAKSGRPQRDRGAAEEQAGSGGLDFLLDVPLEVSVEVGRARMLIRDFLKMKEGGVIELDKLADEPLDLYVNSKLIARGEAVVVNEKFGLRLIDVVSTVERLEKLR